LIALTQSHIHWKVDAAKLVSVYGDNMGAALDVSGVALESQFSDAKGWRKEKALEEKLGAAIRDLNSLLQSALGPESNVYQFLHAHNQPGASSAAAAKGKDGAKPTSNHVPLTLLVDSLLQELPWEGLALVGDLFEGNVCRDFSVHMLGHRCASLIPALATPAGGAAAAAAPAKGGGGVDAHGNVIVASSTVKTLLDPFEDDSGNLSKGFERPSIRSVCSALLAAVPGAAKWVPVNTSKATVSLQDWIGVTAASAGAPAAPAGKAAAAAGGAADPNAGKLFSVLTYVPGKLSNYLPVCDIASMNLEQVAVFLLSDQGHSSNSILRQNALDNLKAKKEIALETPLRMLALWSLAGAGSVVFSSWSTPLASQARFIEALWTAFAKNQLNLCSALAATKIVSPPPAGGAAAAAGAGHDSHNHHNQPHSQQHHQHGGNTHAHGPGLTGGAAVKASTKASEGDAAGPPVMKNWIRHARVLYGVPNIAYADI